MCVWPAGAQGACAELLGVLRDGPGGYPSGNALLLIKVIRRPSLLPEPLQSFCTHHLQLVL